MVDSIITLFESTETIFSTNGLGSLPDAISCLVEEEVNGEYELEMEYPVDGRRYSDLVLRRIIFTKTEPDSKGQPFRIYSISKPINGVVTINAQHISYDLSGYPLKPFSATDIQKALTGLKTNSVESHPFIFSSDKNLTLPFSLKTPASTRVALGGMEGSVLDVYRGEYEWDKFNVILHTKRGVNRGVTIRYGKNLTDIQQDENCNNVYTGVYPYWFAEVDEVEVLVELTEKIIQTPGTFNYVKILSLNLTELFLEKPTVSELKAVAQSYISTHDIGIPNVSIDVAFEPLMRSPEYAEFAMLETVKLGDTVTVEFPKMDIQATSKCVKTIFNVITDKYETITLGSTKSNLASTVAGQTQAIAEKPSSYIIDVIKAAVFEKVSIDQLEASNATITNLVVETAQIADARIYNLEVDTAEITDLVAENIVSINLHSENITAMNADIQDLEVSRATIAELEATNANVTNLQAEVADIDTLVSGNLTSENIQSLNLTSKNTVIEDAMIKDAMISDLGVDKLKAGDISTNKFNIVSDSGNFTIVDNTIQVTDGTKVRVQIGKDASGDYSMYVWDVAGKLMFDAKGITEDAIQSAIIRDDMVSTDANINAAKIDIGSLFKVINEDNTQTLNSSKIMFDAEGQTLNIKLQSLTTSIDTAEQDAKDYSDGKLADYATTIVSQIDGLQGQIDGSIMTWFFPVPPTLLNEPASKWNTTDDKNVHLGDLYYDTISGYCYRWQVVNNAYSWQRITDTDVTKALEDASKAQDTADKKRRVFVATPTVPYDKGDLWAQGATGELMRCETSRSTGSYIASDWKKASKYTDDTRAVSAENNAKAHAETKADEARVAAEAVAVAQANLAKTEAEAYADGIVSAEETERITQDTATLNAAKADAAAKATAAENAAKGYADTQLTNFATAVDGDISDLQTQIDGKITTWFYAAVPTTANVPARTWTTTAMKDAHLGDLYYNTSTGQAYRWKVVSTTYSWELITDNRITTALATAATAKDVADSKRRVFGSTPTPPYDVNDLWVQGTGGDIMRCITASTTTYSAKHWVKAVKYTDDSTANTNLATAKTYAETKANEAKTAAESYAKTKAEAERVLAEAYADGIVDDEEQARITDVNAKLAEAKTHAETKANEALAASKTYANENLATAKTYAETKANDARIAAEAVAVEKANLAQTLANTYADGKVSAEETARIKDANEKLAAAKTHAETKATEAQTAAKAYTDALEIGGRNLLHNTSSEWNQLVQGTGWYTQFSNPEIILEVGETYTFSLIVEKVSDDSVPINLTMGTGTTSYQKDIVGWRTYNIPFGKRVSLTHKITTSDLGTFDGIFAWRLRNEQQPTTIRYKEVKLEKGNKATDWTEAPEDAQARLDDIQANVDTVADSVNTLNTEFNITNGNINTIISSTELETLSDAGTTFYQKYSQTEQELGNYKIELGELSTAFDTTKEEIQTSIVDQQASLNLVVDEISTKVSQTEYDSKTEILDTNYTEFKQDYNSFKNSIHIGGGSNLIKNSVGYGGLNYWVGTDITIDSDTHAKSFRSGADSTWILNGIAKHGWIAYQGAISSDPISLLPNLDHVISGKVNKTTPAGSISIMLVDAETDTLIDEVFAKAIGETFDGLFSLYFNSSVSSNIKVIISITEGNVEFPIEITDLMLTQITRYKNETQEDESIEEEPVDYQAWSQAAGETYTLNVKVDGNGITVHNKDGKGRTVMSPEEFAGYYNDQKIFTLNGDITEVMGLYVGGKGLFIPPVKFVQTDDSLDIVWTGR